MTDTDICNMALSNLGKGVIANMEEGIEDARACKLFYETTRREVLREFPWGFAHRIERLAVVDTNVPGWSYAYGYPAQCLKINNVFNNDYRDVLRSHGLTLSGTSPDGLLVETVELTDRPFYVGVQYHPEFKSRPNKPHPLFLGFIGAALKRQGENDI